MLLVLSEEMKKDVELAAIEVSSQAGHRVSENELVRRAIEASQEIRDAAASARRRGRHHNDDEVRQLPVAERIRIGRTPRDAIQPRRPS